MSGNGLRAGSESEGISSASAFHSIIEVASRSKPGQNPVKGFSAKPLQVAVPDRAAQRMINHAEEVVDDDRAEEAVPWLQDAGRILREAGGPFTKTHAGHALTGHPTL